MVQRHVQILPPEVARKIAAGEVIDRPAAILRELLDNAVDSGAGHIRAEVTGGGIERIRVIDDGCGMTKQDLETCARPHATSKITSADDLLSLKTLGFRGEALASMAAVSRLEIRSGGWSLRTAAGQEHVLTPVAPTAGTIVQTEALFEDFPARRVFLKRPASEGLLCRAVFEEKVLPRPDIAFSLLMDGEERLNLPAGQTLTERFTQALSVFEDAGLFYEITGKAPDGSWQFSLVIGEPAVSRNNRKLLYTFVNGRRIQEYALMQAIEYGCQGYFPNGQHPVACLFVQMDPSQVDFNIHPAKKEARFKDISALHHGISCATKDFFRHYTVASLVPQDTAESYVAEPELPLGTHKTGGATATTPAQATPAMPAVPGKHFSASSAPSARQGMTYAHMPRAYAERQGRAVQIGSIPGTTAPLARLAAQDDETARFKPNYLARPQDDGAFRFIGSALGTFLIAQMDDTLYIIDQHAAHERILYDQIMQAAGERQTLLVPYRVQTQSAADDDYLRQTQDTLATWGFEGKSIGGGAWEFYTVPVRWTGNEQELAHDLLDRRIRPQDIINAAAASSACRQAVMDGTVLDDDTAADIARKALQLPDPHCPHGRPVFTKITRAQLFSLVQRT